jgi:hypothetical protein
LERIAMIHGCQFSPEEFADLRTPDVTTFILNPGRFEARCGSSMQYFAVMRHAHAV